MQPRISITALCVFVFTFCGCISVPRTPDRTVFLSPEAALKHISAQFPDNVALQAVANIRITTLEKRYPLKLAIVLRKPASLRAEVIPLFGPPAIFLSIHDKTLKVLMAETRAFYIGRATPSNVARYLPLKMDPEDLIAVLTGACSISFEPNTVLHGSVEGDHYRIDVVEPMKRKSLWLRTADGFTERLEVYGEQHRLYRVIFEDPLRIEGSVLPQKTTIVFESDDGIALSVRLANIELLKRSDPAIFNLKVPPGITPVYID
jgi:hypothetical protein